LSGSFISLHIPSMWSFTSACCTRSCTRVINGRTMVITQPLSRSLLCTAYPLAK
jgi:hypothetical protein